MPADFHIFGSLPFDKERVKSLASGKAILLAVALSMKAEIPSGPVALVVSRLLMRCKTSSLHLHMVTDCHKLPQLEVIQKSSSNLQKMHLTCLPFPYHWKLYNHLVVVLEYILYSY